MLAEDFTPPEPSSFQIVVPAGVPVRASVLMANAFQPYDEADDLPMLLAATDQHVLADAFMSDRYVTSVGAERAAEWSMSNRRYDMVVWVDAAPGDTAAWVVSRILNELCESYIRAFANGVEKGCALVAEWECSPVPAEAEN